MSCDRCGQHHPRCAAHRHDGEPCTQWPVHGWDKCRIHAGRKVADIKQHAAAEKAVATYGLSVEIDPHDALIEEVQRTAGHVRWLHDVVTGLKQGDLVWGITRVKQGGDDRGTTFEAGPAVWLDLYHRERAHLVKVTKAAIDAGIDERRVRLAESQGEMIVAVLKATLADLGVEVTPEVASTVGRHLRSVS